MSYTWLYYGLACPRSVGRRFNLNVSRPRTAAIGTPTFRNSGYIMYGVIAQTYYYYCTLHITREKKIKQTGFARASLPFSYVMHTFIFVSYHFSNT